MKALAALLFAFASCKPAATGALDASAIVADAAVKEPLSIEKAPPGPPRREANPIELKGAADRLAEHVKVAAADPKEPWIMAHGLLAFGKDMKTTKGQLAIDVIVRDFLEAHSIDGKVAYRSFPENVGAVAVEPHRNLMAKKMLEAGVPLDRSFKTKDGTVTLDQIVTDGERVFVMPVQERDWNNYAWSFQAFLRAHGSKGSISVGTQAVDLKELSLVTLARLEQEQAFLIEHLEANRPDRVQKRKQGIFSHTCGGMHLIQAGIDAAVYLGDGVALRRIQKQLAILLFRWDAERRIYKQFGASGDPSAVVLISIQELKFYGHLLETLAKAKKAGLFEVAPEVDREVLIIAADLVDTITRLEPLYANKDELRKVRLQGYYDLIGDGCHAVHGLREALVAFFPAQARELGVE
jgi:hypothetical protein